MPKLDMPAIIPVSGMTSEFGMEWDSSLVPVGINYTAIEATVYECLHAGCTSIWIVANDDVAPLLRYRLGDCATDVESMVRGRFATYGAENHREVPIYYVPIHPRHRGKVDNYAWSALWGCNVAYWVKTMFSRWSRPDRYYVSFPMGMMDPKEIYEYKSPLKRGESYYFSHEGKTIKDGYPISFVMDAEEWRRAKHVITQNSVTWKTPEEGELPSEKLPIEERLVSRKYNLQDVFGGAEKGIIQEVKNFYDLTTWAGYVKFISSELGSRTKRPSTNTMFRGKNK